MPFTTSCNTQSSAPEDGQNNCPKHVELTGIINKPLLLHLVGCLYYLYQRCAVKQISDNEIYLLIQYIKRVLWRGAKFLSYIEEARCLKVKRKRLTDLSDTHYKPQRKSVRSVITAHTTYWQTRFGCVTPEHLNLKGVCLHVNYRNILITAIKLMG